MNAFIFLSTIGNIVMDGIVTQRGLVRNRTEIVKRMIRDRRSLFLESSIRIMESKGHAKFIHKRFAPSCVNLSE